MHSRTGPHAAWLMSLGRDGPDETLVALAIPPARQEGLNLQDVQQVLQPQLDLPACRVQPGLA